MSSSLLERIKRHIEVSGPLPLAEYMHWCMGDSEAGYYKNKTAIGRAGDFITAPEVSQMFGELIGIWAIQQWELIGKPRQFNLVELGPGRGTLMRDLLRAAKVAPEFLDAAETILVETSELLVEEQQVALDGYGVNWVASLNDIPNGPVIIIANEFLDVLPIRQYVKAEDKWSERVVIIGEDGKLDWALGAGVLANELVPQGAEAEPDGAVLEVSTTREAFISNVAERIKIDNSVALFIDYGHEKTAFGDTFQAMQSHGYVDALEMPGEADLTSHVDFEPLMKITTAEGLEIDSLITQGEFLLSLGLLERAGKLGASKPVEVQSQLTKEAERLALPNEMGDLFKVFVFKNLP